jgi:hypothetical protein
MQLSRNATAAWFLIQGANALSIACGILIAHSASPFEFARFATLSAALAIMTSFLNPLINELAHRIAGSRALQPAALLRRTAYSAVVCAGIAAATCKPIVSSPLEALLLCFALPLSLVGHSWVFAMLSGLHRMIAYGWTMLTGSVIRICVLIPFLLADPHLTGFAWSYLAGFITTLILARPLLRSHVGETPDTAWGTNWVLLVGFFLLALPFSLDQPLIQALFPEMAADYAAVMTYSKSVMLLASPALAIAYSSALQVDYGSASGARRLRLALTVAGLATTFAFVLWGIHPWLFPILLGPKYLHVMPMLVTTLPAIALYVVSYYLLQVLLITARWWICGLLLIPSLLQVILLATTKSPQLSQLVHISVAVFGIQFILACVVSTLHSPYQERTT